MLKIGNIKLNSPLVLAPLSGYTNYALRQLSREFGAELTFPGVFLAKSVAIPKVLSKQCFRPHDGEHPIGAQIMGTEPDIMAKAARDLQNVGYDLLDINFACPAPKVLRRGRGGHLLSRPDEVTEIIKAVRDATTLPISVKLRIGYDKGEMYRDYFYQICDMLVENGVDALVIHGRTTKQKYSGKSDWTPIEQVKKAHPNLPVIGSGDIFKPEVIKERLKIVDGVLMARGIVGNPWLISEARALIDGKELPAPPSLEEVGRVMLHHIEMLQAIQEPGKVTRFFRKFAAQYCKRHPDRKQVLLEIMAANTESELIPIIEQRFL
jgi:nifR3 family TIM-barrel protein